MSIFDFLFSSYNIEKNIHYYKLFDECLLDIYYNKTSPSPTPVIISIHGGGWTAGDKRYERKKGKFFTKNNIAIIAVNYPMNDNVERLYERQAISIANAIHWTLINGRNYNIDIKNISLMGHSAGGHLAALVSNNNKYLNTLNLNNFSLKKVFLIDPAGLDVLYVKNNKPFNYNWIYKSTFGSNDADLILASPINYIKPENYYPNYCIFYSSYNKLIDVIIKFYNKLVPTNSVPSIHKIYKNHIKINSDIGRKNDEVSKIILNCFK